MINLDSPLARLIITPAEKARLTAEGQYPKQSKPRKQEERLEFSSFFRIDATAADIVKSLTPKERGDILSKGAKSLVKRRAKSAKHEEVRAWRKWKYFMAFPAWWREYVLKNLKLPDEQAYLDNQGYLPITFNKPSQVSP